MDKPKNKGGRPKGSPNKVNAEVKQMVLDALEGLGGVAYLMERAQDPRTAASFMTLLGKVLPTQITGADGKDLIPKAYKFEVEIVHAPQADTAAS